MESKGKDANKQTNSSGEFDKTVKWQDNFTLKQTASESASKNTSSVSSDSVSKEDLDLLEKAGRIDQLVALGMQGNKLAIDALGRMNAVEGLCKVGNSSNAQAATHSMVVLFQMAGMNSDTTKKAAIEALNPNSVV